MAIVAGWIALALVILGFIVGFTSITEKEVTPFLMAAIALTVASSGGWFLVINEAVAELRTVINTIVFNITAFVAPAVIKGNNGVSTYKRHLNLHSAHRIWRCG